MVFADSPYRLSRGGVTVNSGRLAPVDKGAWDRSMGFAEDHRFNVRWLKEACRILKPEGTIWVTGTHHIIFIHPPHHLQPRFRPAVDETQDHKPDYVGETRPTS